MCEFDKLDKTFASDLYLIYKRSLEFISDKDQLLVFYLSLLACSQCDPQQLAAWNKKLRQILRKRQTSNNNRGKKKKDYLSTLSACVCSTSALLPLFISQAGLSDCTLLSLVLSQAGISVLVSEVDYGKQWIALKYRGRSLYEASRSPDNLSSELSTTEL